jgi:hypothetical protein
MKPYKERCADSIKRQRRDLRNGILRNLTPGFAVFTGVFWLTALTAPPSPSFPIPRWALYLVIVALIALVVTIAYQYKAQYLRAGVQRHPMELDDNIEAAVSFIIGHPDREHIVALRCIVHAHMFETIPDRNVRCVSITRIRQSWTTADRNMSLVVPSLVRVPTEYVQLKSRLRGPNPIYFVQPHDCIAGLFEE